jgi:hypothetical protein
MKGGLVTWKTVRDLLNPINNEPGNVTNDPNNRKLIGALIIKAYNELKLHYKDLPAIPHEPKTFTPAENTSIESLEDKYSICLKYNDRFSTRSGWDDENTQISTIFSSLQMLSEEEFSKWLRYILEGNVYKKRLPYYTDNEFDKFKSLALSLNKLVNYVNFVNTPPQPQRQLGEPLQSQQSSDYETYVDSDNLQRVKNLCSQLVKNLCSPLVTKPDSILFGMGCVISLKRTKPKPWNWVNLDGSEQLSSNPYCAKRHAKRLMLSSSGHNHNTYTDPLNKINVSMLTYNISELKDGFIHKKINEVIDAMLSKVDIDNIKKQFEETLQFKFIHIVKGNYKYYEFKIFHSRIYDPEHRTLTIPVIICMLSTFDEDGICDFEFVYVCVIRQPQNENDPPIDWRNYNVDSDYMKKLKQETYHKLTAEMTRLQSLLGGQTLNAPTTHAGTLKQYYDTIDLQFEASRTHNEFPLMDSKPVVLDEGQKSEDPCTLILEYEQNEKGQEEPVWKAAKATTTQIAAFKRVEEYLTQPQPPIILDNTSIHVFKISNGDKDKDKNITVFVEVKKQDENGKLLYVYYQALGGERYEVYNNSDVARGYADLNKANYNWVLSTGPH